MVGRGGGKNVGNRSKDGNGTRYRNVGERLPIQNECNNNITRHINQVQNEGNCDERTQMHEANIHSSGNPFENESEGNFSPNIEGSQLGKGKRTNKLNGRMNMGLEATAAADPPIRREGDDRNVNRRRQNEGARNNGSGHSIANGDNAPNVEATSKAKQRGERGKFKSYIVDMKIKGQKSKLKVYIPDDIDRAIGENARHFVNECGRVVRTRAPLNVKNWKEAFAAAGDGMWKEIQDKFEITEGGSYMKLQAFAVDTMQRLYRLWKARLHYYYKSPECGQTDEVRVNRPPPDIPQDQWEHCVQRFGSLEFKKMSERNSKNRLSEKRTKQTTGNLSFAEVEDILTKENNGVKPPADVVWLIEHTTVNAAGTLEWADQSRSKEIHEQLKVAVATHGDSKTQEEILLDVLKPRSGYFRGKGTALRGYSKGRMQLEHQNLIHEQQKQIQEQEQRIKELQETQEKTAKQLEEAEERTTRQLEQQRNDMQRAMDAMKQELMRELISRGTL